MDSVRLLYASVAAPTLSNADLAAIGATSVRNNTVHGITGFLCFSDRAFLQVLEGTGQAVNRLYRTLLGDPRHSDVQLLSYAEIDSRFFGSWSMNAVNWDETTPAPRRSFVLREFGMATFTPSSLTANRALSFLEVLAESERRGERWVRDGERLL